MRDLINTISLTFVAICRAGVISQEDELVKGSADIGELTTRARAHSHFSSFALSFFRFFFALRDLFTRIRQIGLGMRG